MDTPLWSGYNRTNLMIPYAGTILSTPVRDPVTKELIPWPLIKKTDAGPGRLSSEGTSIEFREAFQAMGVHILLSLPNGTECTAEPDQIYSQFKPQTKKSIKRVAAMKMVARVEVRKKASEKEQEEIIRQ